jgi:hypothetical protein
MLMDLIHWMEAYVLYIKYTEALVIASKENCLEVHAEETECMFISRGQNARKIKDRW